MAPPSTGRGGKEGRRNQNQNKNSRNQKDRKDGNNKKKPQQHRSREDRDPGNDKKKSGADELSRSIPIPLQQLLLNIFRSALLFSPDPEDDDEKRGETEGRTAEQGPLAITPLIQTLKTHLYNRDFISAFADAKEDLLRAYALRWSAGRTLSYIGVLDGVWRNWVSSSGREKGEGRKKMRRHALCIGGGAGAEIVALAGVWRMLRDEAASANSSISTDHSEAAVNSSINEEGISKLSVQDDYADGGEQEVTSPSSGATRGTQSLSITAVDIADWSPVVNRLSKTIKLPSVPSTKSCRAPLLTGHDKDGDCEGVGFDVSFKHLDVLSLFDEELQSLLCPVVDDISPNQANASSGSKLSISTDLVTLMFTLNELFSTSIPKATSFLLRMTEFLKPGTVLLVVDSPGSYSTVALGKKGGNVNPSSSSASNDKKDGEASSAHSQQQKPRSYPMRFLLDHALLSVASGSWECVLSDDSRWFRREADKLSYDVGEGIRLEDMRFQVHVYRRLKS